MEVVVRDPAEVRTVELYDVRFRYRIVGSETDGGLAVLEVAIPPRTLVKPHQHSREDEVTVVLEGTIGVRVGDRTVEAVPAGGSLVKPRDVPHAIWNVTDAPVTILELVTPAGLERYFEEIAPVLRESGPEWTMRFRELAEAYGLTILDAWSDELQAHYGITL